MYMYVSGGRCTWEQILTEVNRKKASDSPEEAVEASQSGCWALNMGPLQDQCVLLAMEPTFQPLDG